MSKCLSIYKGSENLQIRRVRNFIWHLIFKEKEELFFLKDFASFSQAADASALN